MAFAAAVLACFALQTLHSVNAQGGTITNLPNTIDVPENFEGIVYVVYSDAPDNFTVAGSSCSLLADTDCGTSGTTCTLKYDNSSTPDFETMAPTIEICEVTATTSLDVKQLVINVLDEDDEAPDTNCPAASDVNENDDAVADAAVTDCRDDNSITAFTVKYELSVTPTSASSKFVIDEDTGLVSWAPAPLNNDFEDVPSYNLTVTAYTPKMKDPSGHSVTVNINDVNEAGVITNLPQVVYIDEFFPQYTTSAIVVDTDLLTLTVYDEDDDDGGTPQSHTGFITDNSCPGTDNWFKFITSTGADTLKFSTDATNAKFDYESTCREFILSIVVKDDGNPVATSQTSTLTLKVLDIPEVPWFNEFDGDSNINTAYETSFSYPDQTPIPSRFVFSESRGISIFQNFDSSPSSPTRPAVNTDGIYIADLNDYHNAREYYDPDCSPTVDGITGLSACSATFQFVNPTLMEPFFEIQQDGATGNYYLYQVNQIDYETLCKSESWISNFHQFEMNVVGVDSSGLQTTNTVTLSMQLNDANEFIPVMNAAHNFIVNENAPFDTLIGDMTCEDVNDCHADDIDRFSILANSPTANNDGDYYFKVSKLNSNTGRLQVLRPVDYELVQQVQFDVRCVDRNTNVGDLRTAVTLVTVSIIDQNDNEPELQETFFSLATRYDTEYRSYITTLSATDRDSGLNAVPIFALGSHSDEFGIDSDTGDVFTKGKQLLPFSTYIVYGVVFDTGEPGQAQNVGKKVATIRVDTFDAKAVLVDLYLGINYANFDKDKFILALEDLMHPFEFFTYELNAYVMKENVVSNGVRISVYAIESDVTLKESGLDRTKVFVRTEELLAAFREYADGTPSELFQSPQIISFGVRHVEATPIRSDFSTEEDKSESWMVDTPEGNVVLALIVLLALFVLIGIVFAFYNFMRRLDCYRPPGESNSFFPARDADNKLHVGKINTKSVTALAREEKQVAAPATKTPPDPATKTPLNPPKKPQIQPVIPSEQTTKPTTATSREGGRKIWEIKKSRELDGSFNPLE